MIKKYAFYLLTAPFVILTVISMVPLYFLLGGDDKKFAAMLDFGGIK